MQSYYFLLFACQDIVQERIDNARVLILSPADGYISPTSQVNFLWEDVDFASSYRMRIAQPNFENPNRILFDSIVVSSPFNIQLGEGQYEFGIRAVNNISESLWSTISFQVDSATNLGGVIPSLIEPEDGIYTSDTSIVFR